MEKNKMEELIENISNGIKNIENNNFNVYFFVADSKGVPNGMLFYEYTMAKELSDLGFNVSMIYTDEEFIGVESWMGEDYAKIPHKNIGTDNVSVSLSDFLFIPEAFGNVMEKTKTLPCKKIMIAHNLDYLSSGMPIGCLPQMFGINVSIVPNELMSKYVNDYCGIRCKIVHPKIEHSEDRNPIKKLSVSMIGSDVSFANGIVNLFKWKYPSLGFVPFRVVGGLPHNEFRKSLNESSISVWYDDTTYIGISALEALEEGNIVVSMIPQNYSDWMISGKENDEMNGMIFCQNVDSIVTSLASVIFSMLYDESTIYSMKNNSFKITEKFNEVNFKNEMQETFKELVQERIKELHFLNRNAIENKEISEKNN